MNVTARLNSLIFALGAAMLPAPAWSAAPENRPQDQPAGVSEPLETQSAAGNIAELQQLIHDAKLVEMRVTYNGSYGATLMFLPGEMVYYVALFQQKKFWRVIKTQNDIRAETIYADFSKNTASLAESEIRRIKLEAEKAAADRLIAAQQNRADRLQADLDVTQAQQSQVADQQQQQADAIRTLQTEQAAAQVQLRALQMRLQQLQRQTDSDLSPSH
jgi:Protein of unknown function (DUF2968)